MTSGLFYLLSLFFFSNSLNVQVGYKPNEILFKIGGSFYILAIIYFMFHNFNKFSRVVDAVNICVTISYFVLLLRVNNQIQKYLPFWLIIITLIINISLIYSVVNNPNFVIGLRATVQFGEGDFTGNPGIYARNGLFGYIISLLFLNKKELNLFKQESFWANSLTIVNLLLSVIVIIITQTRMILMSTILITIIYILFVKKSELKITISKVRKRITYSLIVISSIFLEVKYNLYFILKGYFDYFLVTFERAVVTALTLGKNRTAEADESAMGRVENINLFVRHLRTEKFNLIIGKGFNYRYLDVPILEVFLNFGIIGLLLFLSFLVALFIYSFKALRSPLIFQNFMGLVFIQLILGLVSAGRPMDLTYCIFYMVYIRFLGIQINNNTNKKL